MRMNNEVLKIEKIVPGGMGLATMADGKKIFLWNALPGEEVVEYEITKKKSHYLEGIATKIENPSPYRVKARDEGYLMTSPWQIFDYEYELRTKGELVREMFREQGLEIEAPEVRTDGKEWGYRNKMEYVLWYDKETEEISLAFHKRGTHRKEPIRQSSIERPEIYHAAEKIASDLSRRREDARKYQSLVLRASQDKNVSGGLYENHKPHPTFPALTDKVMGREYRYSPNGFFQINLPVYEMALEVIREEVKDSRKILDLYSGVGTIGLSVFNSGEGSEGVSELSREGSRAELTLVECDKYAYGEMKENAAKVPGAKAVLAKSEDVTEYIEPDMTVIVDPPRAGCDKKLLDKILEVKPSRVIYLSCNPMTQARDVAILQGEYIMRRIIAFNFFPKTPHIENLVVLKRK